MGDFDGIFDIHAHAAPDPEGRRSIDVFELAKLYRDAGFRGFLYMGHFDPTAGYAYLAKKAVPQLEIYGGIVLNSLIGGFNKHAVRHFANLDGRLGRIVYMPTVDCENEVIKSGGSGPYVRVAENGKLLPEVLEMLDLIAELGLAVSTGHNSPAEILLIIQAAKARGIDRILVSNPHYPAISMGIPDMVCAAEMGAYLEFIYYCVGMTGIDVSMEMYSEAIRAVGPDHAILSSCGGQSWMPIHTFGWSELLQGMREQGFTAADIDLMAKINPLRLLAQQ